MRRGVRDCVTADAMVVTATSAQKMTARVVDRIREASAQVRGN